MTSKTWWLTGLPGAGKTTLANALGEHLRSRHAPVCILDGDQLRDHLSHGLGFSQADRAENIRRAACVARLLNDQSINAIVALISPFRACREHAKTIVGVNRFIEVHVSTPLDVCSARDPKGLYAKARADSSLRLTGYSDPYEPPTHPHVTIDTSITGLDEAIRLLAAAGETTP